MKKNIKEHCNKCNGKKNHEVLFSETVKWHEDVSNDYTIWGSDTYDLIKCCGCENVSLKRTSWFSEECDEHGNDIYHITFYPPTIFRKKPKWLNNLSIQMNKRITFIDEFITEIYVAIQNNSLRLAAMGIRALLEQVMINKVGDNGSFNKNINAFQTNGHISENQKNILLTVLEAGHAAIHRNFNPNIKDIINILDITENIIESIYVNILQAEIIKKRVPKRKS